MDERSYLSIGEVLALLQDEFPDVTISKIRFLESQGLIDPERTPSGYRKFYGGDVERLRFILREQREHFLPLKVIKDRLDNGEPAEANGTALLVAETLGSPVVTDPALDDLGDMAEARISGGAAAPNAAEEAPRGGSLTADQLCAATGLSRRDLVEVERYGLLSGRPAGGVTYYDANAVASARLAAAFLSYGVEPRHLRLYRNSADREAALFEQIVLPMIKQRNPQARAHAVDALLDLTRHGAQLREVLLRQALQGYLEG
jgi:DNA-binding transcriptional MerR regulator